MSKVVACDRCGVVDGVTESAMLLPSERRTPSAPNRNSYYDLCAACIATVRQMVPGPGRPHYPGER